MTARRQLKSGTPPELIGPDAQHGFTGAEPQTSTPTSRLAVSGPATNAYLRNYSLGMILVAVVVCLANYASAAPGHPAGGRLNLLCLVIYLAAVACSAARIVRDSQWRFLAWSWLAVLLISSAVLRSQLPVEQIGAGADWSFGAFGFVAAVVLFGQPLSVMVGALTANCCIGPVVLAGLGHFDQQSLVPFAATSVGVSVFPLAAALFYPQLATVDRLAAEEIRGQQALLAQELKASQVAADRAHRSTAIESTAAPLLQALADGTADPQDSQVRTAARIESARLRRLFAEVDEVGEPLLHEVRASMDAVERHGVAVTLETRGTIPSLPVMLRRALLEAPMSTLASAASSARIVIMAGSRSLSVSVVTDGPPGPAPAPPGRTDTRTTTTTAENVTWTQTSWEPA
jgi:hypothetical protein